ncbi:response regulator [Candidatus Saccharibacteria bacterium]|nr:response regulator [Candidatus Saccharibacteria bacterium]
MAKIMLVEDDNNLREIYEARLIAEGYEIVSAKDGEEALAMAVKEKPDLIISDVMMPKISGFDMLDILRTTPETKNTKIIMMTALSQAEDKSRADKLGADRYLVKSQVTLEDVAAVAREVLSGEASDMTTSPDQTPPSVPDSSSQSPAPVPPTSATDINTPSPVPTQQDQSVNDQTASSTPAAIDNSDHSSVATSAATTADNTSTAPASTVVAEETEESKMSQSSADAEKKIDEQINNFVATAKSTEPPEDPKPEPPKVPEPVASQNPTEPVEHIELAQAPPDNTVAAADNAAKLASAVNDMLQKPVEGNDKPPETLSTNGTPGVASSEVNQNVDKPDEPASPSAAKKVIEPLNDINTSGPDLNALLQQEELKEASANGAAPQVTTAEPAPSVSVSEDGTIQGEGVTTEPNTTTEQPTTNETAATDQDPNNPNNIAL